MATSVTNLTITKISIEVGDALTFRQNLNTNFTNYKSEIESKINSQIRPAITELQGKVGEWPSSFGTITNFIGTNYPYSSYGTLTSLLGTTWSKSSYGTISERLAGAQTGRRVLVGIGTDARSVAKVNDIICEIKST